MSETNDKPNLYEIAFREMGESVVIIDCITKRFVDCNVIAHERLGYSREEFLQLHVYDIDATENEVHVQLRIQRLIESGRGSIPFRTTLLTKSGRLLDIEVTARSFEACGHPLLVSLWRDVKSEVNVLHEPSKSEQAHRKLLSALSSGIVDVDATGTITLVSLAGARLLGSIPAQIVGQSAANYLVNENERKRFPAYLSYLVSEQPSPASYTTSIRRMDGKTIDIRIDWDYMRKSNGAIEGFAAVVSNITEEVSAHRTIEEYERRLKDIIDQLLEYVVVWHPDGTILFCNRTFASAFVDGSPVTPPRLWSHSENDWKETCKAVVKLTPERPRSSSERLCARVQGGREWVLWNERAVFGPDGKAREFHKVGRSLLAEKANAAKLRELDNSLAHASRLGVLGEMVAGIAHQLNQPLTAIATRAAASSIALKSTPAVKKELHDDLAAIEGEAIRAAEIIRRLRTFVAPRKPGLTTVKLKEVIEQALTLLRNEFDLSDIKVKTSLAENLPTIYADIVLLQQVLVNLLTNAMDSIKSYPSGLRMIKVNSYKESPTILAFSVADSGRGVPEGNVEAIFKPFFSTRSDGLGMGLSVSRTIMERHGGTLKLVAGEEPGATFEVRLPITWKTQAEA